MSMPCVVLFIVVIEVFILDVAKKILNFRKLLIYNTPQLVYLEHKPYILREHIVGNRIILSFCENMRKHEPLFVNSMIFVRFA